MTHNIRFDSTEHVREEYLLDWSHGDAPMHYKRVMYGMNIYQGDRLVISYLGQRNPSHRRTMCRRGFDVRLFSSETQGLAFSTPEGEVLFKNQIDVDLVLLDHERKMMFTASHKHLLVYLTPGAMPIGAPITTYHRNEKKEQEVMQLIGETLETSLIMQKLVNDRPEVNIGRVARYLRMPRVLSVDKDRELMEALGDIQRINPKFIPDKLRLVCRDGREHDFLYFTERK